jgi:N-acyl-D-amino-acid deacylase
MMESVEDIPADSIMDGLSWNWESYGEYLADLDRLPKGVNAGGMVGHCAVRYNAMGERGLEDTEPTATELAGMQATVDEAMTAGALGFSTSRTLLHRGADGRPIPGTFASVEELTAIVSVLGRHGRGVFEAAAMLGDETEVGGDVAQREVARFGDVSRATGRPMTFGLTHIFAADSMHTEVLASVAAENATGATLFPQTTVRGIGIIFGLAHRTPWDRRPAWAALQELTLEERLAVIRDPQRRAELVAEAAAHPSRLDPAWVFPLVEAPAQYRYEAGDSLAAEAARRGVDPAEAYLQLADETDGRALLNWPFLNQRPGAVE